MSRRRLRPFDDKTELERELMDVDYRFLEGQEVSVRLASHVEDDEGYHAQRPGPVDALAPAVA